MFNDGFELPFIKDIFESNNQVNTYLKSFGLNSKSVKRKLSDPKD
jgi:hypothetical protein